MNTGTKTAANPAESRSFLSQRISRAVERGLKRAYGRFGVKPDRYLNELRRGYGLPIATFGDLFDLHPAALDNVAERAISGSRRMAILEGAGFGLGGAFTLLPDVSILGIITLRLIQKLSLVYGFEYTTEEEQVELWMAVASAAGVDVARDWIKKQVIERLMTRIAQKAGTELAEKITTPISSLVGDAAPSTIFAISTSSGAARLFWVPPRLTQGFLPINTYGDQLNLREIGQGCMSRRFQESCVFQRPGFHRND